MKSCDSPQPMTADYVMDIFTQEHDPDWISFLMKRTGGTLLSQAATIVLSDISGGGFHINGENQPFFFLRISGNAYLFDDCIVVQAPDLPESITQTMIGRDAGQAFGYDALTGIPIRATERLSNNNLRCVLDANFSSLPEASMLTTAYFWVKLFWKNALSIGMRGSLGQKRLNKRLKALQRFMQ